MSIETDNVFDQKKKMSFAKHPFDTDRDKLLIDLTTNLDRLGIDAFIRNNADTVDIFFYSAEDYNLFNLYGPKENRLKLLNGSGFKVE